MLTEEQIAAFVASERAGCRTSLVALADRLTECGDARLIQSALEQLAGIRIVGRCQFDGCSRPAHLIACGREIVDESCHPRPGVYCLAHARVVQSEAGPKHKDSCPNCGCRFGVH